MEMGLGLQKLEAISKLFSLHLEFGEVYSSGGQTILRTMAWVSVCVKITN